MLADAEYLTTMHAAVTSLALPAGLNETDAVSELMEFYRERLEAWRELSPPGLLAEAHAEIVRVSEEILRRLQTVTNVKDLGASEDLRDIVERGASAFRVLQRESDRLGLGLSFR
jgi:hypothetical protein